MKKTKYIVLEQNSKTMGRVLGFRQWTKDGFIRQEPMTFDEACEAFPNIVEHTESALYAPGWGQGHYIKGDDGMPVCECGNWDTSG